MKKQNSWAILAVLTIFSSCTSNGDKTSGSSMADNPFLKASTLHLQAPAFDKIKDADFKPALEEGMKQQLAEIQKIADNAEKPTFENTLVALEKSGQMYGRVNNVFNLLTG